MKNLVSVSWLVVYQEVWLNDLKVPSDHNFYEIFEAGFGNITKEICKEWWAVLDQDFALWLCLQHEEENLCSLGILPSP